MACDSLHRLNFGGSNSLLFENCQWSEAQGTNVDVTTVPCNKVPDVYGPMENYSQEYLAMFAAKCIPSPGGSSDGGETTPEEVQTTADETNKKIKLSAFILIMLVIIGAIILFF